ncbi:transcriptional regulator, LysR family [Delftia acidovorans SPH-1]|jgi:DNA-binding transcriptional LysR family regulator|uniref:Transcriptional regulator, LysR family n=3 Tax=Pseudomonadati TaxID=3379134 RepID=A9BSK2_DELAS|nr:transcriptional regulator, LysR family [Delftia acidovorans SPH-1]AEF92121.1 transcriptional regulator, LysR family [Delftia sp. Cs1-4]ATH13574.1 LysR family transcriptional regulator [Delftia acidovorans]EZP58822.1 Transcriptional regulator, LysR family [Delftia sp. RIT313]MBA4005772.1 LysR family transcriptional regulator [Delftia sp.]OLE03473.1 MAG: LysR family transcriptional regulator [Delftia sp. 13_1_20CM_4_67_18]OLE93315.1 MAG: LysR family transcriptional regulator [Delftia sp. 13_
MAGMETKWLEDFVSLAETRSFSRSAQLRHVTQPAFSRRIQALEAWAGTDLVDRSSYPTRLTPAGKTMYDQALEMLQSLQSTRTMLRAHVSAGKGMVGFAVPHTLAFTFFPNWVSSVQAKFGPFRSRLFALNVHDAVMRLVEGGCDLLIAYFHPSQPFQLDPARYEMVSLGHEVLAPYAKPDADGLPLHQLPGRQGQPLPYLGYAPGAYLGRVTELILKEAAEAVHLERVYETDMAEGLKAMALEGHGVAFLPFSAVRNELEAGRLVSAAPAGDNGFRMDMEVRAYREKPASKDAPQGVAGALWNFLLEQGETIG